MRRRIFYRDPTPKVVGGHRGQNFIDTNGDGKPDKISGRNEDGVTIEETDPTKVNTAWDAFQKMKARGATPPGPGAGRQPGAAPGRVPSDREVSGAKREAAKQVKARMGAIDKEMGDLKKKGELKSDEKERLAALEAEKAKLAAVSKDMDSMPVGVLHEKLKDAGMEVASVKKAAVEGNKSEAEVDAMKAQAKQAESAANKSDQELADMKDPETGTKAQVKAKMETERIMAEGNKMTGEGNKLQGEAALAKVEIEKDMAGSQKFSAYSQGIGNGLQGAAAGVNAGVAIAQLGQKQTEINAQVAMKDQELKAADKQNRDKIRSEKESRNAQMAQQNQQAADSKYGSKNRAPDSAGAALASANKAGTDEVTAGVGVAREKYSQRDQAGNYRNPRQAKQEQTIAEFRQKRQQDDERRRSAKPQNIG